MGHFVDSLTIPSAKRKGETRPGRAVGTAKSLYEFKAEVLHRVNDARQRRLGFLPTVTEKGCPCLLQPALAGRDVPMVFRAPSPVQMPPVPPGAGPAVQTISRTAIGELPVDLHACLLHAGQPNHRASTSQKTAQTSVKNNADVVLRVLGGEWNEANMELEGQLSRHGFWYHYPPFEYGARRPHRRQDVKALYISGDTSAVDFAAVTACLVTKPPKLMAKVRSSVRIFGASAAPAPQPPPGAMTALDVIHGGPGYGPYTLLFHETVVEGKTLEILAQVLTVCVHVCVCAKVSVYVCVCVCV